MSELVILVGFPGSGKSYYAAKSFPSHVKFDDTFTYNFFNDQTRETEKGFKGLVEHLDRGENCVLSDVNFCHEGNRDFFTKVMRAFRPQVCLRWEYFEANANNCRYNIEFDHAKDRDTDRCTRRLKALAVIEKKYVVPNGTQSLPVGQYGNP